MINKKEPYLDYFNGDMWKTANKSKVICDMLLSKKSMTDEYYGDNNINDCCKKKLLRYEKYSDAVKYFVNNFVFDNSITKPSNKELRNIYKDLEKDIYSLILNHKKNIKDKYSDV